MNLEPYGWHSPAQVAARTTQRLELRSARAGIRLPAAAVSTVRSVVHGALHLVMSLERFDRRVAGRLSPPR